MKIAEYLSAGQENAVSLRYLMGVTKLDSRVVRRMIASERLSGTPILSNNTSGYYLPANEWEKESFARSMRHRALEIERLAQALENTLWLVDLKRCLKKSRG